MWPERLDCTVYLCLSALEAAADHGVTWPVQHPAQLLAQFEGCGTHKAWGLAAKPDEHIRPAVQDIHAARVQETLQLWGRRLEVDQCWAIREGSDLLALLPMHLTSRILGISSTLGGVLCSTDSL